MLNQKQQNLIEQNLQMVMINHQDKILSPQVCSVLEESTQKISPQDFLPILFETLLEDEEFIRKNYYLLSQENLSEESQKIVLNNLLESRVLGWLWRNAGKIGRGALDLGKEGIKAIQQYVNPRPKKMPLDRFYRRATYIRNPSGIGGKWRYNQGTSVNPYGSPSGFYIPGEYVVDPDTGREVWKMIPGVKPSDLPQPPLEENRQMFNTQQKNLIEQNLQTIIIENKAKIMSEFMHSPEMYKMLIENKTTKRPSEDVVLFSLFEFLLSNQEFIHENYKILSKQQLTEQEKNKVVNYINESWKTWLAKQLLRVLDSNAAQSFARWWDGPPMKPNRFYNVAEREPGPSGKWRWNRGAPGDTREIWPVTPDNPLPPAVYPFGGGPFNSGNYPGYIPTSPFGGPGE